MKIASIVPIKNADRAFEGSYSMILAPLAEHFTKAARKKPANNFTILDNGVYEEGKAVDMDTLIKAAIAVGADEIILPDVIGNQKKTLKLIQDSLKWFDHNGLLDKWNLMAVCQGSTREEFAECFEEINNNPYINTIGIPKVAGKFTPGGRISLEYLWRDCKKAIHLLGCYKNMIEYKAFVDPFKIRSADTCLPALLSIRGSRCNAFEDRPEPTIDLINDEIDTWRYDMILTHLKMEDLL